jgi:hypothetical protein
VRAHARVWFARRALRRLHFALFFKRAAKDFSKKKTRSFFKKKETSQKKKFNDRKKKEMTQKIKKNKKKNRSPATTAGPKVLSC